MGELERKILENASKVIAQMDDVAKAQYLAYGEGMLAAKQIQESKDK